MILTSKCLEIATNLRTNIHMWLVAIVLDTASVEQNWSFWLAGHIGNKFGIKGPVFAKKMHCKRNFLSFINLKNVAQALGQFHQHIYVQRVRHWLPKA